MGAKLWEDIQAFNVTDLLMTGGFTVLDLATQIVTGLLSSLSFLLERGSAVMTCVVMLFYLMTSRNDWLLDAIASVMPMISKRRQDHLAHEMTMIVEASSRHFFY